MATSYTWEFPALDVVFSENTLTNVVQTVTWGLIGTDGSYQAACYGSVSLGAPNPAAFTPYDQLTKQQVQGWTEQALGQTKIDELKANIQLQINSQKNATTGELLPPWVVPVTP